MEKALSYSRSDAVTGADGEDAPQLAGLIIAAELCGKAGRQGKGVCAVKQPRSLAQVQPLAQKLALILVVEHVQEIVAHPPGSDRDGQRHIEAHLLQLA